ncbi:MAG: anhydro-N-acetylmuramic acid kinase [Bacteroidales bacterium]
MTVTFQENSFKDFLTYRAIGVMSGTSLDGLDLSLAEYSKSNSCWKYKFIKTLTVPYPKAFKESLKNAMNISGNELMQLDAFFGEWIAKRILEFIPQNGEEIHVVGSHGHTIFHNPKEGYTTQIGSGAHIAALTGIPCVCNFRMADVARKGQGAPLAPIGDELLFNEYDFCLNIGGIANISHRKNNARIAYDICPANMILNHIANQLGKDYDKDGKIGQAGEIIPNLLSKLNELSYYKKEGAKSLGREWFESTFLPIIKQFNSSPANLLRTLYEHIAIRIAQSMHSSPNSTTLITGGGARNKFLTMLLKNMCKNKLIIPSNEIIDFKESLIFGFLAVLYQSRVPSCLCSATGALEDSIGGCLYY